MQTEDKTNSCGMEEWEKNPKAKNKLGRIMVASGSSFKFVPQTVLQLEPGKKKESTNALIGAINKGEIGSFELEMLDWISKLKYSTKAMIMDLILSGYISLGKREKISADKISIIFERLYRYNLIDLTRLVAISDEGVALDENRRSVMRVNTLGKTGHILLKEIGRHPQKRDVFTVLADGNTVKKCLSANQWLIYWLTHFTKEQIRDYSIVQLVNMVGVQWSAARIYATVNMEKKTMIAEPVKRCEAFEVKKEDEMMRDKFLRFAIMFENLDKLYSATREPIIYTSRPVITYLCEDDEHVEDVVGNLKPLLKEYPAQEVWFTTDLRMFNYSMKGQRFKRLEGDQLVNVNIEEHLGVSEITMEERGKL